MAVRSTRFLRAVVVVCLVVLSSPSPVASAQQPDDTAVTTAAAPVVDPSATTVAGPPVTEAELETTRLDDPEARRTINLLIGLLAALAVVLVGLTVWFWRATRPVAAALEPLAAMSTRHFRRKAADEQEGDLHAIHKLKASTDPPPRAADLLRQARGDE
jgi:hypothetical protein